MRGRLLLLFIVCGALPALGRPCPTSTHWPNEPLLNLTDDTRRYRPLEVEAFEKYAFTLEGADEERAGLRTDGVVILRDGAVVYEKYARGHSPQTRHLTWSISKSVLNALVGLAVKDGFLSVKDSVCTHLSSLPSALCGVTVEHLLSFTSGLDWQEVYENQSNQASSVLAMLYGQGRSDMVSFVASHGLSEVPGKRFSYSSGDSMLLSGVLGKAVERAHGDDFPWTKLFQPLGMGSAVWERDGAGVWVGSSYLYATPRDLARFGHFLLKDGCWNNVPLLPEGWLRASTQVTEASREQATRRIEEGVQGWHLWLNREVAGRRRWPSAPEDAFAALGHWGQSVTVLPSLNLVVVRTADDRRPDFRLDEFLRLAIAVGRMP